MEPDILKFNEEIRRNALAVLMGDHCGWVKELSVVNDAAVYPQTTRKDTTAVLFDGRERACAIFNGGVYDSSGKIVPEAIHIGGSHRNVPDANPRRPCSSALKGRWLFGGFLRDHFGHFLVESLVRLWGCAEREVEGIVFINYVGHPRRGDEWTSEAIRRRSIEVMRVPFIRDMLSQLTGGLPVICVDDGVRIEELVVPTQLSGNVNNGTFIAGHPYYASFLRSRLTPLQNTEPYRKIYLSRSMLDYKSSKFLLEDKFENLLVDEGYEIIHPQKMSIIEQVTTYLTASKVIAATGSAVHLLALATHSSMDVALLDRNFSSPEKFKTQLLGMGAKSVVEIRAVDAVIKPSSDEDVKRLQWYPLNGIYNLDMQLAWNSLFEAGFVSKKNTALPNFESDMEFRFEKIIEDHDGTPFTFERRDIPPYRPRVWPKPRLSHMTYIDFIRSGFQVDASVDELKLTRA